VKTERVSFILGLCLTLALTGISYSYLRYKNKINLEKEFSGFFDAIETVDMRFNDLKYKFRGERSTDAPVALLAIDDISLKQMGRWPWSRETIAKLTQKLLDYGVASVGFDVIFSEPERGAPEADAKFGEVVDKGSDRVILGTFGDNGYHYKPFQDYCVTEAFLGTGGELIVKGGEHFDKLNLTIAVDDVTETPYDQLNWAPVFTRAFELKSQATEAEVLKELSIASVKDLTDFQKGYLENAKFNAYLEFCKDWDLESETNTDLAKWYHEKMFASEPKLAELNFTENVKRMKAGSYPHPIPQRAQWTANIPVIQEPAKYTASFVADLDGDGYIRRYPLFYRAGKRNGSSFIPSLALQSYLLAKGLRAEVKIDFKKPPETGKQITAVNILKDDKKLFELPVDSMGKMLVNYYGPRSSLPYVSAKDLFTDKEKMMIQKRQFDSKSKLWEIKDLEVSKADFLKGRSIIIGATAIGIYDLRNTPLEANYPGPEVHVSMLANLLDGNYLQLAKNETLWMTVTMAALGLLLSYAWANMGPVSSMGLAFACGLLLGGVDLYLFFVKQVVTSGLLVIVEVATVYFVITVYKYFTEEKKKRELKSTFSKYVSPAVVDELLKDAENLKLGGRKQRMTAFFSDVRGFTTISEKLSPDELSKLLNRYLTPMTEIVFANHGTLDKYMGDAIMAFFGAPINDPKHAEQAVRCALHSITKLKEIQKELAAENLPNIDIGIGINTGEMSVGNMGSNIVQNYTVMGDSVNLASRLEGINKEYGTRIIISEFTYADVKDTFVTREVDRVKVKGKTEPVRIFEVIQEGAVSDHQRQHLDFYKQGYELYYQREFEKAKSLFAQAALMEPEDEVSRLYIERCEDYLVEPPTAEWDGVYVMKTK